MASHDTSETTIDEKQPNVSNEDAQSDVKTSDGGIILIPQPSSDPRDPLVSAPGHASAEYRDSVLTDGGLQNWSMTRKATITATLFLAMFVGFSAPFCGQLNIQQQARLYHKTTVQITYFVSLPTPPHLPRIF
jgi:hypothetical protein